MERATEREQIMYCSLPRRPDAVHTAPGPMPPRLIRSRLAYTPALLSLVQPRTQHPPEPSIVDGDAVAWNEPLNASRSRTARYPGGRTLCIQLLDRCHLASYAAFSPIRLLCSRSCNLAPSTHLSHPSLMGIATTMLPGFPSISHGYAVFLHTHL